MTIYPKVSELIQ